MKTLNEITNGYLSIFERVAIMAVASRLDAAACCDHEAEDAHSEEFCDCVHCILCGYVVSGSFTAAEIPCDVPILLWVNAQSYVINWFNDYNDPDDDFDSDDDTDLEQLKACIGDYVPHPYSAAYLDMVTSGDYELDDDDLYPTVFCTEDVVDTETTEDMMYPDCSTHFTTKDMEAEYAHTDVSCKDCPDDECTGHCMSCYYR